MAEDREISNPELKEKYGITITGKERVALTEGKLMESRRQGRSFSHVLTDKGWHHAREIFHNGIDAPSTGFAAATLKAFVSGLQRHMERTDIRLAEIFGRGPDLTPTATEAPVEDPPVTEAAEPSASVEAAPSSDDIETMIRKAYAQLADKPNAWVSLTLLRPRLGDAPRDRVDAALRQMIAQPDVRIVPWENQKTLTQADRDAAVLIGDQPKHRILIGA
nr:hypothetical protein [Microbispora cellulosiformans]